MKLDPSEGGRTCERMAKAAADINKLQESVTGLIITEDITLIPEQEDDHEGQFVHRTVHFLQVLPQ